MKLITIFKNNRKVMYFHSDPRAQAKFRDIANFCLCIVNKKVVVKSNIVKSIGVISISNPHK